MGGLVTLTTDFGLKDAYAAALEGAIVNSDSTIRVVHVSHQVPPGRISTGAYLLEYAARSFPAGSVHLGVVDPGVGSDRHILAVGAGNFFVVGPDNGLLKRAFRGQTLDAVALAPDPTSGSHTFESRDVMAPAAARLATGTALRELGKAVALDAEPEAPGLRTGPAQRTAVAHVDNFGTLVLDLRWPSGHQTAEMLRMDRWEIRLGATFSDVGPGDLVAYRSSIGYLEVAIRDGSAAEKFGLGAGAEVEVELIRP
jgi:S-adenosyl-L-methionine hydrolase (adenosine-forming)